MPWQVLSPDDKIAVVKLIQKIVDMCWPESGYVVTWGCPILMAAKDRIYDRHSQIGKIAITLVQDFFAAEEYRVKPAAEIAAYAKYAVAGGLALYGIPAPQGVNPESEGYTLPEDLYYSTFIIQSLASFLKITWGSLADPVEHNPDGTLKPRHNPVGALAMIAAAVERVFETFFTGKYVPPAHKFSQLWTSGMVTDHLVNTWRLTPRRWKEI
ncbi:hypothetical protein JAAARDRAFT_200351 [Jaapia argillacea MUCL 33604]|uniref:Uncharacterized protein n=1 Tax=Jaapia argillacea MUCL 33604 TaxID=933084 RepID=A0A067P5I6_9AGAM|nr:hypothetical protein JAAARDRAFT_200351 [Jaapia argillacea MUCL 33604]